MPHRKKNSPLIFEGVLAERYKKAKNRWTRLTIISTLLPLVSASFVSLYNGSFDVLSLFGNGEIVMSLFSLTIPLLFDLFEIKKEDDENLSWAFFYCAILVCIQMLLYCLIRIDDSDYSELKSVISSLIMLCASWMCCNYSIKVLFMHSTTDRDEEDRDAEDGGEHNA